MLALRSHFASLFSHRYDPLAFLTEVAPPQGHTAYPSWDPLQRLHAISAPEGSTPLATRNPPSKKYDAIAQLVEFLAQVPQLVEGSQWAEAGAHDPLRVVGVCDECVRCAHG